MGGTRYITIQEWMLQLGIGGNDLLAYALVWGFCQNKTSHFSGSYDYIAHWLGCSRRTVFDVLARLEEKGLIRKETTEVNSERFCNLYALIPAECKFCTGGANSARGSADSAPGGGADSAPHNNREHNAIAYRDNNKTPLPPFNFLQALLDAGVSAETATTWLEVRKAKRCVNSELAWQATLNEIRKSGYSPERCIREAVVRSWAGFKAEWLQREENGAGPARARKVDNVTYMVRQMQQESEEQMRMYNPQDDLPDIDEQ